jgi:hypothetical protein
VIRPVTISVVTPEVLRISTPFVPSTSEGASSKSAIRSASLPSAAFTWRVKITWVPLSRAPPRMRGRLARISPRVRREQSSVLVEVLALGVDDEQGGALGREVIDHHAWSFLSESYRRLRRGR